MSYSLNSLNGEGLYGGLIGIIKRATRSFDYSSYVVNKALICLQASLVVPLLGEGVLFP